MTSVHDVDLAMQTVLDSHLDEHARALTAAWAAGWEDVKARLEAALLDTTPDRRARIAAAVDAMAATLADLTGETKTRILGSLDDVVALGVQGEAVMASTALGYRVQVARADPAQVRAIIDRTTGQITSTTDSIGPDAEAAIRRRLVSGVALGDHPNDVAASAVRDVDGHFNGGLTRALNISRTEMADAMRAGQKATDLANPGIITGWVWTAHLDSRTCFPAGTPVITARGDVPIQDVRVGDLVVTHTGAWQAVTETLRRHYSGPMVTVHTADGAVAATADHPLLVKREGELHWVQAEQVRHGDSLLRYCDGGPHQVHHRGGEVPVEARVRDAHYDEASGLHVEVLSGVPVLRPGVPVQAVDFDDHAMVGEEEVDGVAPTGDRRLLLEGEAETLKCDADVPLGDGLPGVAAVAAHRAEPRLVRGDVSEPLAALRAVDHDGRAAALLGAVGASAAGGVEDGPAPLAGGEGDLGIEALAGAESPDLAASRGLGLGDREVCTAPLAGEVDGAVVAGLGAEAPGLGGVGLRGLTASLALDGGRGVRDRTRSGVGVFPLVGGVAGSLAELPAAAAGGSGRDSEGASALVTGHFHPSIVSSVETHNQALDVFNIEVSGDHTYVAGGYAVHNCQACVGMHGTVHPPDEDGPNDHHSGRCARVPMTVSWAALGIVGVPEPDLGAVDADAWVDGLDDTALASLLGRKGADAYRAGEFPRDRWAETRSNPGWRDSIAPARPKETR